MTYRHFEKVDNKICFNLLMFKMFTFASIYSSDGHAMHFRLAMARFQLLIFSKYIYIFFCSYFFSIVFYFIIFMGFFSTKWHIHTFNITQQSVVYSVDV